MRTNRRTLRLRLVVQAVSAAVALEPFATFDAAHEGDGGSELRGLSVRLEV